MATVETHSPQHRVECMRLTSFTVHEQRGDILIFIMTADTTASPVDLYCISREPITVESYKGYACGYFIMIMFFKRQVHYEGLHRYARRSRYGLVYYLKRQKKVVFIFQIVDRNLKSPFFRTNLIQDILRGVRGCKDNSGKGTCNTMNRKLYTYTFILLH